MYICSEITPRHFIYKRENYQVKHTALHNNTKSDNCYILTL